VLKTEQFKYLKHRQSQNHKYGHNSDISTKENR
jgi:hypothetical protein